MLNLVVSVETPADVFQWLACDGNHQILVMIVTLMFTIYVELRLSVSLLKCGSLWSLVSQTLNIIHWLFLKSLKKNKNLIIKYIVLRMTSINHIIYNMITVASFVFYIIFISFIFSRCLFYSEKNNNNPQSFNIVNFVMFLNKFCEDGSIWRIHQILPDHSRGSGLLHSCGLGKQIRRTWQHFDWYQLVICFVL